jgi:hypothetical protein
MIEDEEMHRFLLIALAVLLLLVGFAIGFSVAGWLGT